MNWHQHFAYCHGTGRLFRKHDPKKSSAWNSRWGSKPAGTLSTRRDGRRSAVLVGCDYGHTGAHRVIWEMMYGSIPKGMTIDHIDRNPWNNVLSNLRLATYEENNRNRGNFKHNKSGIKGVFWEKDRSLWKAVIYQGGKLILIGRFADIEDARKAREHAEVKYFGEYRAA